MSRLAQLVIIGLLAAAASMARAHDNGHDNCEFTAPRSAKVDTAGAKRIEIHARAGSLVIEGVKDASQAQASGRACASEQKFLDDIRIETRREGDVAYVEVVMPDTEKVMLFGIKDLYATLDLRVSVPEQLPVVAVDSSGEAEIRNLASLNMTDSSGELRIDDVRGDLTVRDSSGEIRVKNIGGTVRLTDSSGDVEIDGVERDVLIDVDSSGGLEISRVKGDVRIDQDSSGDIRIADVEGAVRIDTDSSGGVDVRRVGGGFKLGSKGSGGIHVADVKGEVDVPQR